jgi:glycine dehydrogenase
MTDFAHRHIGSTDGQIQEMLGTLGLASLDALVQATVPQDIQLSQPLNLSMAQSEEEMLAELRRLGRSNQLFRSFIGMGYYDCLTPPVIARNILENPAWYTQYTPYQAEIAQGRLEALLNFQTMVADLTGLPLANASLLDEATAAAEAMSMCRVLSKVQGHTFFVAEDCHPQTLAVLRTRAQPLNITLQVGNPDTLEFIADQIFGLLLSYPSTDGALRSYEELVRKAHEDGALVVASTDLLALTLLVPPGEWGADIAVGSSQRFGVPMGYGGPHAAFLATKEEFKRQIPGRVVGVSKDTNGRKAYRLALQTREQHIRRDRATSNICTAQVLLANMASMYAVYHGPEGLKAIASRIHHLTNVTAEGLRRLECKILVSASFDTLRVQCPSLSAEEVEQKTKKASINFRRFEDDTFGISLDETTTMQEISQILTVFSDSDSLPFSLDQLGQESSNAIPAELQRHSPYLTHRVFHEYHSEHELLRYMYRLQSKDLSLVHSMIPLGSCTMKL